MEMELKCQLGELGGGLDRGGAHDLVKKGIFATISISFVRGNCIFIYDSLPGSPYNGMHNCQEHAWGCNGRPEEGRVRGQVGSVSWSGSAAKLLAMPQTNCRKGGLYF